jgi:hypothetical protein
MTIGGFSQRKLDLLELEATEEIDRIEQEFLADFYGDRLEQETEDGSKAVHSSAESTGPATAAAPGRPVADLGGQAVPVQNGADVRQSEAGDQIA